MIKKGSWLMLRQGHMVGYLLQEQRVHCGSSYLRNGLGMLFAAIAAPFFARRSVYEHVCCSELGAQC